MINLSPKSMNEEILDGFARNPKFLKAWAYLFLIIGIIISCIGILFLIIDYPNVRPIYILFIPVGVMSTIFSIGFLSGKFVITNRGWANAETKKVIWPTPLPSKKNTVISLKKSDDGVEESHRGKEK